MVEGFGLHNEMDVVGANGRLSMFDFEDENLGASMFFTTIGGYWWLVSRKYDFVLVSQS